MRRGLRASCRTRSAARVKSTRRFCLVASTPSAIARCVLPVPIGPAKIRFSGARDPLAARERMNLRRVDALGGREIERVQRLDFGKARLSEALADHRFVPGRLLGAEDLVEILLVRPVRVARLAGEAFKDARDARHLQRAGLGDDEIAGDDGRAHTARSGQPLVVIGGGSGGDVDVAERRRDLDAWRHRRREARQRQRRLGGERDLQRRDEVGRAAGVELAENLGKQPGSIARVVRRVQRDPRRPETARPGRAADREGPAARPAVCARARTGSDGSRSTARQNASAGDEWACRRGRRSSPLSARGARRGRARPSDTAPSTTPPPPARSRAG